MRRRLVLDDRTKKKSIERALATPLPAELREQLEQRPPEAPGEEQNGS